jgi:hypothetical protein
MIAQLLSGIVLAGLTAASLLVCLAKWGVLAAWEVKRPEWLMRRCDFCAGYWLSVLLLLTVGTWYMQVFALPWYWLLATLPAGLPAAAVCRAVAGEL